MNIFSTLSIMLGLAAVNSYPHGHEKLEYLDLEPTDYYGETLDYYLNPIDVDATAWNDQHDTKKYIVKLSFSSSQQNAMKKIPVLMKKSSISRDTIPKLTHKDLKIIREENSLLPPWPIRQKWSSVNGTSIAPLPEGTVTTETTKATAKDTGCKLESISFISIYIYSILHILLMI